jgi:hypothetical protein
VHYGPILSGEHNAIVPREKDMLDVRVIVGGIKR